jgi:hypothetical protein
MKGARILGALGVALLLASTARAVEYTAFEQITVGNAATGVTRSLVVAGNGHMQANLMTCRLETAQVRYRYDGTAPTSSVGTLLEIGDVLVIRGLDVILKFQAIRTGSTSGVLDCTYTS